MRPFLHPLSVDLGLSIFSRHRFALFISWPAGVPWHPHLAEVERRPSTPWRAMTPPPRLPASRVAIYEQVARFETPSGLALLQKNGGIKMKKQSFI
jgi:hypothetical protein